MRISFKLSGSVKVPSLAFQILVETYIEMYKIKLQSQGGKNKKVL